ncbi:MAG: C-terminal binding protein [candidate division NC10 bacterium]|nr:C-terminal binding protein [candidate division NC10 bacterium]
MKGWTMPLAIITDCNHGSVEPEVEILQAAGVEVRSYQALTEDDAIRVAAAADAILTQYARITARVLDALPRCRVIVRYGVGVDTIDLEAAAARGIIVANVPDYCIEEVSDHALTLLFGLWRGTVLYDRAVRQGVWNAEMKQPMFRLAGRVLGILGGGRIGTRLAQKALGVGMAVIGYDPYVSAWPAGVRAVNLETLLRESDAVSIHCPLCAETQHLMGEAQFRLMKPTALVVNTARGGVIDTAALVRALREGWIGGAALDALEEEPIAPDSPLLALPNVLLTPHMAWYSRDSTVDLKRRTAEAALAVLRGGRPSSVANPAVFTGGRLRATGALL